MSGCGFLITETSLRGSATLQVAASADGIVVDTLSWERGTDGCSRQGHSIARLSAHEARRLRGLLGEALACAELAARNDPRQIDMFVRRRAA